MNCKKCGNELSEGSLFCNKCGKTVLSSDNSLFSFIKNKSKLVIKVSIIITIVIVILFVVSFYLQKSHEVIENSLNTISGTKETTDLIITQENKYSREINLSVELIGNGKYAEAMSYLNDCMNLNGDLNSKALENELSEYATAMYNIFENKEFDGSTRVRGAKMSMGHIKDNYEGPFSDKIRKYKKLCDFDKYAINEKQNVEIGMDIVEVFFALGYPNDINSTKTANSISQQLCYDGGSYVYLENGIVTAIQK